MWVSSEGWRPYAAPELVKRNRSTRRHERNRERGGFRAHCVEGSERGAGVRRDRRPWRRDSRRRERAAGEFEYRRHAVGWRDRGQVGLSWNEAGLRVRTQAAAFRSNASLPGRRFQQPAAEKAGASGEEDAFVANRFPRAVGVLEDVIEIGGERIFHRLRAIP